jgi:hypothetical protein
LNQFIIISLKRLSLDEIEKSETPDIKEKVPVILQSLDISSFILVFSAVSII